MKIQMFMIRFNLVILLISVGVLVLGQENKFPSNRKFAMSIGSGMGFNTIRVEGKEVAGFADFNVALSSHLFVTKTTSINMGMGLSSKGGIFHEDFSPVYCAKTKLHLKYLDFSFTMSFPLYKKLILNVGFCPAYLLDSRVSYPSDVEVENVFADTQFSSWNHTLLLGSRYRHGSKELGLVLTYGLNSLSNNHQYLSNSRHVSLQVSVVKYLIRKR